MRKFLLILATFLVAIGLSAQVPLIEWEKSLGGSLNEDAYAMEQTSDNGYILTGWTESNDGDVIGNSGHKAWVVKLDMNGNIQWQKTYGNPAFFNIFFSIKQTIDGGYIAGGYSNKPNGTPGDYDYWIVKLDINGNIQWEKFYGSSTSDVLSSVEQTIDGGYVIAGVSSGNNGDVTGNHGGSDYWIVKLNNNGDIQWQKSLGGTENDSANSIQQTIDGGYIVAGTSNSNNGDVTGNHGGKDYWIVKLSSSGNIIWQKSLGGTGNDYAYSIQQTIDGGYIVAGESNSNNGDVIGNHGESDYWIVKLSSSGNIIWQKSLGGSGNDVSYSIEQTQDGGYIVAGESNSNNGDVTGNHGGRDFWIVKLSSSGSIQWQKCLGGSNDELARSIKQSIDGKYITAGYSYSNDGDITGHHGSYASTDFWIVKLSNCTSGLDLYIKDSQEDSGIEPNTISPNTWSSKDIWVRNSNDNGTEHENPAYGGSSNNFVYVRIINNSCQASTGVNDLLEIYWTKANTASTWPDSWDGTEVINGTTLPKGNLIGTINIPAIQPGDEAIIPMEWTNIPNPYDYENAGVNEPWHFCLLARINSPNDPMTFPETENVSTNVRNNNNIVSKNVTIVNVGGKRETSGSVAVYNPLNTTESYDLEFKADDAEQGRKIFEEAEIYIILSDELYVAWAAGGYQQQNINFATTVSNSNTLKILRNDAKLKNIILDGKEMGVMALKFNFLTKAVTSKKEFTYYVTQMKNSNNEVVGGNTYFIKKSTDRDLFTANTEKNVSANKNEIITLSVEEINEDAVYNWYDSEDNLVSSGTSLAVIADIAKTYKVEIIAKEDGYKDYADVEVILNPHSLQSIAPNPSSSYITLNYTLNSPISSYLSIVGYTGNDTGVVRNYIIDTNSSQKSIDISGFAIGFYTVSLICDGQTINSLNLIKQ
ncbi:MAG: hypothetical protein WBA59_09225 [Moheibacter sp.]